MIAEDHARPLPEVTAKCVIPVRSFEVMCLPRVVLSAFAFSLFPQKLRIRHLAQLNTPVRSWYKLLGPDNESDGLYGKVELEVVWTLKQVRAGS